MSETEVIETIETAAETSASSGSAWQIVITILIVIAVLAVLFGLFVGYWLIARKVFRRIFRRPHPMPKMDVAPTEIDQSTVYGRGKNWFYSSRREFLNVRVDAFDKVKLAGYYRPSADRKCKNAVILLHGYNEQPAEMAAYARLVMSKIQCSVLIAHERAHGMSGGKYCTFGMSESMDVNTWIGFIQKQLGPDARIYIVGRSMGAVAALLAAEHPGFSDNVVGIIADSPYENFDKTLRGVLRRKYKSELSFILMGVYKNVKALFGYDMSLNDCAANADKIRVPVLFFSGSEDAVAPTDGVKNIYDNVRSPKRMVTVDGAGHCMCYDAVPPTYEKEVQKFIETCVVRLVNQGRM